MQTTSDLGVEILDYLYRVMHIDDEWSIREPRSLTWWPHDFAQSIWADPPVDEDDLSIVRLHAETEYLQAPADTTAATRLERALAEQMGDAVTSGLVYHPETGSYALHASMFLHRQNDDWARRTFQMAAGMQASEAAALRKELPRRDGVQAVVSTHPSSGPRREPDELLSLLPVVIEPAGQQANAWVDADGWRIAREMFAGHGVPVKAGKGRLEARFPWTDGTRGNDIVVKLTTKDRHARLGAGLHGTLTVPGSMGGRGSRIALALNRQEATRWTRQQFLGSWSVQDDRLVFALFVPNILRRVSDLVAVLAVAMAQRARWVAGQAGEWQ